MMNIDWIYGPHVWFISLAYLAALLIVSYCVLAPVLRLRKLRQRLRQAEAARTEPTTGTAPSNRSTA